MELPCLDVEFLREQIIGGNDVLKTPFGDRLLTYCDYTASGRCLSFVEDYLREIERRYANTHTQDSATGRHMTGLLHEAEHIIKDSVNAGPHGRVITCGTGSTGAITKFQELLGVALAPATRRLIFSCFDRVSEERLRQSKPVVFIGPYEHHSNEVTWREGLAGVVRVRLDSEGRIDLNHLKDLLQDPAYENRLRIGSFSAGSNVTGMRTDVRAVARLLHDHDALACFDYAAAAPYVPIDMNPEGDPAAALDAVFISPHKFLGGPGAGGVLVFNEKVYDRDLAPSVGGGGTVQYVGVNDHDFLPGIEDRERPGTPGILQTLRAALAFQVKSAVDTDVIERRERANVRRAMRRWSKNERLHVLGHPDPDKRLAIISFNVRCPDGAILHPKLTTVLLNDLFGIQSRAGCSCAGPYGHHLLHIDEETSESYRGWIDRGYDGIKPGWCRVGFHYVLDEAEVDFMIDAVDFLGGYGHRFLPLYRFDLATGRWQHRHGIASNTPLSLEEALSDRTESTESATAAERAMRYEAYMVAAREWAESLDEVPSRSQRLEGELEKLQFFALPQSEESILSGEMQK